MIFYHFSERWPVQSRQPVNQLEERLQESNLPPRLPVRAPHQLVVWRSPTDTGLVQSLSEKSEGTRNPQSCWSENSHSNVWSEKLLRTLKQISDSSQLPLALSRYVNETPVTLAMFYSISFVNLRVSKSSPISFVNCEGTTSNCNPFSLFAGSQWSLLGRIVWGYQLVCYSRQACHNYAQRYPTGSTYSWWTCLNELLCLSDIDFAAPF